MANSEENFRPLIYLKKETEQGQVVTYLLNAAVYLPTNYTLTSSGIILEREYPELDADTVYVLYVKEKTFEAGSDYPEPIFNEEELMRGSSNELNWRSSGFESQYSESGKLIVKVVDVTPGKEGPKGKGKIVLADADDTDIKPLA